MENNKKKNLKSDKLEDELIVNTDPKSPISEKIRTLRTNIEFTSVDKKIKTLLVTSPTPGDGKSWLSANLAIAFAQSGKKVLLVDSDLRKGRQHKVFKIDKAYGLSNYLFTLSEKEEYEQKNSKEDIAHTKSPFYNTDINNLTVMIAGSIPPNPSELIESEKMKLFIEDMKKKFDIIIFDGSPVNVVTDSLILSRMVDASVLVASVKNTQMKQLEIAKKSIDNVGGKVIGVVINKMPIKKTKEYKKYYSYYN